MEDDRAVINHLLHIHRYSSNVYSETTYPKTSKQHLMVPLLLFGFINICTLRANLSIAIIDMTSNKTKTTRNESNIYNAEFIWDSQTEGFILSVYFLGILFGTFCGYFVSKFGSVKTYGFSILISGILTILLPLNLYIHFYVFMFGRFLEGVLAVVAYASIAHIWSRMAPKRQRSKLAEYSVTGACVGICMTYLLGGYVDYNYGWRSIFYITGIFAVFWSCIWFLLVSKESVISELNTSISQEQVPVRIPWKDILQAKSVIALIIVRFSFGWVFTILTVYFPLFLKDITNYDTYKIGIFSGIPYFIGTFFLPIGGFLMEYSQRKNSRNITREHKFCISFCLIIGTLCLILTTFLSNFLISMICLVFSSILLCTVQLPINLIPTCLAPEYESMISGVSSFFYALSLCLSTLCIGFMVSTHSVIEWRIFLMLTGLIVIIGVFVFGVFGSSETEPWSRSAKKQITFCLERNENII